MLVPALFKPPTSTSLARLENLSRTLALSLQSRFALCSCFLDQLAAVTSVRTIRWTLIKIISACPSSLSYPSQFPGHSLLIQPALRAAALTMGIFTSVTLWRPDQHQTQSSHASDHFYMTPVRSLTIPCPLLPNLHSTVPCQRFPHISSTSDAAPVPPNCGSRLRLLSRKMVHRTPEQYSAS